MIENDKVIRERAKGGGGCLVFTLFFNITRRREETDFLSELFLSQSKNVNGTELESF